MPRPDVGAAGREVPPSLLISAFRTCETLPVVGGLFTRGRQEAQAVLSLVVAAVIEELDVDEMVRERITAETVDAVVARLDLVALANRVIDGVDLRAIIRESTSPVTVDGRRPWQRFRDRP